METQARRLVAIETGGKALPGNDDYVCISTHITMGYAVFQGSRVPFPFTGMRPHLASPFLGRTVGFLMTPPKAQKHKGSKLLVMRPHSIRACPSCVPRKLYARTQNTARIQELSSPCLAEEDPCKAPVNYHELNEDQQFRRRAIIL